MTDFDLITTCSFSGHRELEENFNYNKLEEVINKLIEGGFKTFLVGMALGFDIEVMKILVKNKNKNIDIIACIPCPEQSNYYSKKNKEEYDYLLKMADKKVVISENYTKWCMQKRNRYMVDNSSTLVAYLRREKSGTAYTVNYAKSKDKKLIII